MGSSVCEAPMKDPCVTADVEHKHNAEIPMLCASTFTQFVGPGSDEAALIDDITQPPMKKSSEKTNGSVLVVRSAANAPAVYSYMTRISTSKSGLRSSLSLRSRA
jgi:hypothetical protein